MNYPNFEKFSLYDKKETQASTATIPKEYQKDLSDLMASMLVYPDGTSRKLEDLPTIDELWNDKRKIKGLPRDIVEMAHRSAGYVLRGFRHE